MERYLVGGAVRDQLLGVPTKDFDFVVVAPSFEAMRDEFLRLGGRIWQERPEFLTIRGQLDGVDADFVVARRDGNYSDGRRPDTVEVGTLFEDLSRRDFTINAIAQDMNGRIIDPFKGVSDINLRLLKTVGDPMDRFREDGLRVLRALRFIITKDMQANIELKKAMRTQEAARLLANPEIAIDRVRGELMRMLKHDTPRTLSLLNAYPNLTTAIWRDGLWLKPTNES